ncbi:MAG: sugar kinase [Cyanobacteriota bacterium]|nr:sugar kinase [Cyanobacteriota bacterium]
MSKTGLFVGMLTLDFLYLTNTYPEKNQKVVATDYAVTAGGPATNAAVSFSYFENHSHLLAILGSHPITQLIKSDLERYDITVCDLDKNRSEPPPVSSIITTEKTGDRSVISINATKSQVSSEVISPATMEGVDIVLIDGHQMSASLEIAEMAKAKKIPIVIDGGSWKPGFEEVLVLADYVICSANFYPPKCKLREEVFSYLSRLNIPYIAITGGGEAIEYLNVGYFGRLEVPQIEAVDTLGAGDIFHGAFCHYVLEEESFVAALESAAKVASHSCKFFGTREWMVNC